VVLLAVLGTAGVLGFHHLRPGGAPPPAGFVDVAARAGLVHPVQAGPAEKTHIRESMGQGACWIDYDGDGDPDLFLANGARRVLPDYAGREELHRPWRLYRNRGGRFEEVTARAGLDVPAWALGCAVGDVNADGFDDLFVTTAAGPNRLFVNAGDGRFVDRTAAAGVGARQLSASAAFGDLDGDADLDLFVTTYLDESRPPDPVGCRWKGAPVMCGPHGFPELPDLLYENDGTGTFREVGREAGVAAHTGYGLGVVLLDADDDGDLDPFVANDSSPNHLFVNQGGGRFIEDGFAAGVALSESGATQAGMGVEAADLDGDGRADLVVTNFSDDVHNFYRNQGGWFTDWSGRSGLAAASFSRLGWAVLAEDFDLDGDLDLFFANGHVFPQADEVDPATGFRQPVQVLWNDGAGGFSEEPSPFSENLPVSGRGAAVADFDDDLDPDVLVVRDGEPPLLLQNSVPAEDAPRLRVLLRGRPGNPNGLGARLELEASGRVQVRHVLANRGYLSASEPTATFGLGQAAEAELTVSWPGGPRRTYRAVPVNRVVVVFDESPGPGAGG
jgi:hypothetical protein